MQMTISIDDSLYAAIERLARKQDTSPEEMVAGYVAKIRDLKVERQSPVGLFADEPGLMEDIAREAMEARERDPLRTP